MQAMWFPTFDKIHSLQKKYEPAVNCVISESKFCYLAIIIIMAARYSY